MSYDLLGLRLPRAHSSLHVRLALQAIADGVESEVESDRL